MNERTRSAASNGSSRTTRSSGLAAASSSSANGSKTSLFRSHFIRRPNAASSDPEGVRADVEMQQSETADLVVRDQHGEVEIGNPRRRWWMTRRSCRRWREKQRLAEAIRHYQISHSSMADQPDALFEAVRESNRSKVSALAEDNWMFEPEEQPRIS
ncbi:hypothetical protein TrVFT333_011246 [Trichoderma virens FT-333]|nr:hypothetical protein TrVFT333_011246 [Trichoderma virens FT-333]